MSRLNVPSVSVTISVKVRRAFSNPLCVKEEWAHWTTDGLLQPSTTSTFHLACNHSHLIFNLSVDSKAINNYWTELMKWTTGMDCWTDCFALKNFLCEFTIPVDLHPVVYKHFNTNSCLAWLSWCLIFLAFGGIQLGNNSNCNADWSEFSNL